jgi:hypothetical protein
MRGMNNDNDFEEFLFVRKIIELKKGLFKNIFMWHIYSIIVHHCEFIS